MIKVESIDFNRLSTDCKSGTFIVFATVSLNRSPPSLNRAHSDDLRKFVVEKNAWSQQIQHPNLMQFIACTVQTNLICTIHEEVIGENLYYLNQEKFINWEDGR